MSYKSMLLALLLASSSGCAVYGGSGYGYSGYERPYSSGYYRTQRYPVYVVPQRYPVYRHEVYRHSPRYVVPAPPRHYQSRSSPKRHDYRAAPPSAGWSARRDRDSSRGQQPPRQYQQSHRDERRGDERRGWERQRN